MKGSYTSTLLITLLLLSDGTAGFLIADPRRTRIRSKCHRMDMSTLTSEAPVDLKVADYSAASSGETSAPPVILLHGLLGSKRNFSTLAASLAAQLDTPRHVLALDLRNHGDSDWRDEMSYQSMADDVLQTLERLGYKEAVLVGHSMGGKVAQTVALLQPSRVAGLVVLDMAPVAYTEEDASWKAVKDIIHVLADLNLEECQSKRDVDKALLPALPDPALRAFVLTNLGNKKPVEWKIPIQVIAAQLDVLAGFPSEESTYEGDSFFIHGGQSKFVRHSYMETIQRYFPNHMLTTIRGAGHWIHAEAPDDVLALLKRYLDR